MTEANNDYPLGGMLEPHDIERDQKLENKSVCCHADMLIPSGQCIACGADGTKFK